MISVGQGRRKDLFAKAASAAIAGIDGVVVTVEVDVSGGLPCLDIVGLADTSVREARQRVRSALHNSHCEVPQRRITVNLAPASLQKEGSQMDVGIAAGILAASGQVPTGGRVLGFCFLGELALNGEVRPVKGVLGMAMAALHAGYHGLVIPFANRFEVSFMQGLDIRIGRTLVEIMGFLKGDNELPKVESVAEEQSEVNTPAVDMADIRGQATAKRALEVACAGGHNILMCGPPGAGKTMLAKAIPGILPELSPEEARVVTRIHSIAGVLPNCSGLMTSRPFRAPHHTTTVSAMVGGGANPRPGEVTLAHRGVLFLDELPLFPAATLNALRQPIEDGETLVSRSKASYRFPSRFLVAAGMNPCPCGYFGTEDRQCTCTEYARRQYASRISGPLRDRMDLSIEVARITVDDLTANPSENSRSVRARVSAARKLQETRLRPYGMTCNADMGPSQVTEVISVSTAGRKLLLDAYRSLSLSARAYYRVLKVASSIADLGESPRVEEEHIAEALSYRQRFSGEGE